MGTSGFVLSLLKQCKLSTKSNGELRSTEKYIKEFPRLLSNIKAP
jgi:hypothetical protein